jgi:hypothetical protein
LASDDIEQLSRALRKLRAINALTAVGFVGRKIGELFQEAAALIFIFVPLELWDKTRMTHNVLVERTLAGTAIFFTVGLLFHFGSVKAYRYKKDLEGVNGNTPGN